MTETRELIEQKIALGWDGLRISERLGVPLGDVVKVREAMNELVDVDLFELFGTPKVKDHCGKGLHRMTLENTYIKPSTGRRECVACREARMAARYRMRAA